MVRNITGLLFLFMTSCALLEGEGREINFTQAVPLLLENTTHLSQTLPVESRAKKIRVSLAGKRGLVAWFSESPYNSTSTWSKRISTQVVDVESGTPLGNALSLKYPEPAGVYNQRYAFMGGPGPQIVQDETNGLVLWDQTWVENWVTPPFGRPGSWIPGTVHGVKFEAFGIDMETGAHRVFTIIPAVNFGEYRMVSAGEGKALLVYAGVDAGIRGMVLGVSDGVKILDDFIIAGGQDGVENIKVRVAGGGRALVSWVSGNNLRVAVLDSQRGLLIGAVEEISTAVNYSDYKTSRDGIHSLSVSGDRGAVVWLTTGSPLEIKVRGVNLHTGKLYGTEATLLGSSDNTILSVPRLEQNGDEALAVWESYSGIKGQRNVYGKFLTLASCVRTGELLEINKLPNVAGAVRTARSGENVIISWRKEISPAVYENRSQVYSFGVKQPLRNTDFILGGDFVSTRGVSVSDLGATDSLFLSAWFQNTQEVGIAIGSSVMSMLKASSCICSSKSRIF